MNNLSKGISLKNGNTGLTYIAPGTTFGKKPAPVQKSNASSVPVGGYNPAQVGMAKSPAQTALSNKAKTV